MEERNFEVLKDTINTETMWCIESINNKYPHEEQIPYDITLKDFIGTYNHINLYDRGMLFAYLSNRDKARSLTKL